VGEKRRINADISSPRMLVSAPWPATLEWASGEWHRLPTFVQEFNCRVSMPADGRAGDHPALYILQCNFNKPRSFASFTTLLTARRSRLYVRPGQRRRHRHGMFVPPQR
jgi:hypothetical protein